MLALLRLLAHIREMTVLARWAEVHWEQLRDPLSVERVQPPHATTNSRTLARCSLGAIAQDLTQWLH